MSNISFLHQTTTLLLFQMEIASLSNISFLHQTTTSRCNMTWIYSCQISLFYIKPQLQKFHFGYFLVVKYLFSTSNHNVIGVDAAYGAVVKYLFSTSNHNVVHGHGYGQYVVKYLFSTSNHNFDSMTKKYYELSNISFLHQTTTLFFGCLLP